MGAAASVLAEEVLRSEVDGKARDFTKLEDANAEVERLRRLIKEAVASPRHHDIDHSDPIANINANDPTVKEITMDEVPTAIAIAGAVGRWALFVDPSGKLDKYYSLKHDSVIVVDMKSYIAKKNKHEKTVPAIQEELRSMLVSAMTGSGKTLYIAMKSSAPDFYTTFCTDDAAFPLVLFDKTKLLAEENWRKLLRTADDATFLIGKDFNIVFSSTMDDDEFVESLSGKMPVNRLMHASIIPEGATAKPRMIDAA